MERIDELRAKIDLVDKKIVELLNKRADIALEVRSLKLDNAIPVYDEKREKQIFNNILQINDGPLNNKQLKKIYLTVLKCMKEFD